MDIVAFQAACLKGLFLFLLYASMATICIPFPKDLYISQDSVACGNLREGKKKKIYN